MEMYRIKEVRAQVTYLCNLRCKHCYALDGAPLGNGRPDVFSVPDGALVRLLARFREAHGTERLSLTGGEVLLPACEPCTLDLTRYARSLGMTVRIITNGTFLTEDQVRRLLAAAGDPSTLTLQISVDSADPAVHDGFRGVPGSLARTIRGIQTAKEHGIVTNVRCSIRENEIEDVVTTYERMSDLGVDGFIVKPVFQTGRARTNKDLVAHYGTVREAQRRLAEASCGKPTPVKLAQPVFIRAEELPRGANVQVAECNCGKTGVTIDQQGDVLPCNFISGLSTASDWILGNILDPEFDLVAVWEREDTYTWYRSPATSRGTCPSYGVMENSCG